MTSDIERRATWVSLVALALLCVGGCAGARALKGFQTSPYFDEQVRAETIDDVRIVINAPSAARFDANKPTLLIFYALPNGNTIEQTVGAQMRPRLDWHFDIQHIGAQTRVLREIDPHENVVVAYVEAEGRSWPTWRAKRPDNGTIIRKLIEHIAREVPGRPTRIAIAGHSGGGSFIFGYLNGAASIPKDVARIVFLDANYAYSDDEHHGEKLLAWLRADRSHRLIVMAYDDRDVELNGKKIVSETGGTYRASHRMIDRFDDELSFTRGTSAGFDTLSALDGRVRFYVHPNPQKKILHTTMVGEWNGLLEALTSGTPGEGKWGTFGGERAYTRYIQPAPATEPSTQTTITIPPRPADAIGGRAFIRQIADLAPFDREAAIVSEITRGNIPEFLRAFKAIRVKATGIEGVEHVAEYQVMLDYLAVGSDDDFFRVPMTPMSAQAIADAFGCSLPTRRIVDDVYAQADVKLDPRPLTEAREVVATFVQHHEIIEQQRAGKPLGLLVAGIKKDVVITNRLKEKPNRVAIYGWHKPGAQPIQPLTIVHKETYVDYSHGIRLVRREMNVDGREMSIEEVLKDPHRCAVISDEGVIDAARY